MSVTKCNHLVDFNKVAISREKLFLIRPISADLDYTFQQNGNKLREVVFNSGEFARIRLICAFSLFIILARKKTQEVFSPCDELQIKG